MKNITVEVFDDAGVEQTIKYDFPSVSNSMVKLELLIKDVFKDELEKVSSFLPDDVHVRVDLQQKKEAGKHVSLACFLPSLSTRNKFRFSLYYSSFLNLLKSIEEKSDAKIEAFRSTVLHELIHALDLTSLNETESIYKSSKKIYQKKSFETQIFDLHNTPNNHFSVQWTFFHFLATFRNEGVAILGESLLGTRRTTVTEKEALQSFQNDFNYAVNSCLGLSYYNRLDVTEVIGLVQHIGLSAYKYADVLLFSLIKKKFVEFSDLELIDAQNKLNDQSILDKLLNEVLQYDLSDWIRDILNIEYPENGVPLINHEQLYHYCGIIQRDHNEDLVEDYASKLLLLAYNENEKHFIELVESSMGVKMEIDVIQARMTAFMAKEVKVDLEEDLKVLSSHLLNKRNHSNHEVIDWALTYLLDDEDLIHDRLSFLGLQDDWMVVEGAHFLIK